MSRFTRRLVSAAAVCLLAPGIAFSSGGSAASAAESPDGQGGSPGPGTSFTFGATLIDGDTHSVLQQSTWQCLGGWGELGLTPSNPTDLTYSVYFWCTPDAPDMTGFVQARLLDVEGEVIHEAEPTTILPVPDPTEDISEGTVSIAWPVSFTVQNRFQAIILSVDPDDIWLWGPLPPGCVGTLTQVAFCELDWDTMIG